MESECVLEREMLLHCTNESHSLCSAFLCNIPILAQESGGISMKNLDSLKIYGIIENAEQFGMNRFCSKS